MKKKLKQGGAWFLAVCMMLGSVQLPSMEAKAADVDNIALTATATASGYEANTSFTAGKANDGIIERGTKPESRWASDTSDSAKWLQLQWDQPQTMKSFAIEWERHNPTDYAIAVSDDGATWKNVWSSKTAPTDLRQEITLDQEATGKYVRLNINAYNATSDGFTWNTVSVFEFEVYAGGIPDNRSTAEKIVAGITAPSVSAGDAKIAMPDVPSDYTVDFQADYEQVIGRDGTIYAPLEAKTVKGFYEVSDGTDTAKTAEFTIEVPGAYEDDADANAKPDVIPALQEWHGETGSFESKDGSKIVYGEGLEDTAAQFASDYKDITGKEISIVKSAGSAAEEGDFYLTLGSSDQGLGKEGYRITIGDTVAVEASEATGAHWGAISILQILKQTGTTIPKGTARDYPKYEVRGFMLDVGRKTFELDIVKAISKNLAWYKMNNFHVHLSDNLIFLEDYPTIDEAIEHAYSGFRLESSLKNDEGVSLTSGDVYYTKDEFRSFIQDSRKMGVSIVPEFDMPAHALAITRVFQDSMTKKAGGSHSYLIEEMDITKPETTDLAQSIWNDYFSGDDPVFDKDTTVHIGTDEFHGQEGQEGRESFRKFSDDMIKFIQGTGRTVRMWGSLSNKSGTTPVASKDVQLNIWNTGYANPTAMYNLGYDMINTLEGSLYIVPSAGYYNDYLNSQSLYNSWTPNNFAGTVFNAGDDQILGGTYAIWNDQIDTRANGISEYDVFDRFFQPLPSLSEKMWGEGNDRTYEEMRAVADTVATAPNTNPYHEVASKSEEIINYAFDDESMMKDSSGNGYDIEEKKNASTAAGKIGGALKLNGEESYVKTPVDMVGPTNSISMWVKRDPDSGSEEQILCETSTKFDTYAIKAVQKDTGKVGFSREGYDYSFNYELPKDQWVYLTINGYKDKAELYINKEYISTASMDRETKTTGAVTATLILPVERIGSKTNSFKGLVDEVSISTKPLTAADYSILDRSGWTVQACSQHSGGPASYAVDGDASTFWHTDWANSDVITGSHNHYFEVTLPEAKLVNKLSYLPRQNSKNGRIYKYDIVVTKPDGTVETVVTDGTWEDTTDEKYASFAPIEAAKINLVIKQAGADSAGQHGTIAELNLYQAFSKETAQALYDQYAGLDKADYTDSTWVFFEDAYAQMKSVLGNPDSAAADYTSAYTRLRGAAENLVKAEIPVPDTDYAKLKAEISAAEKITLDGYTADSAKAFQDALAAARAIAANPGATQAEVDDALSKLQTAKSSLTKVPAPVVIFTKLKEAVTAADQTPLDGYTSDSAAVFRSALANAKKVLANGNATQAEVDKALSELENAKAGLKKAAPAVPAKGSKFTTKDGLTYKVTKSHAKKGTVAVTGTTKKKGKVTIPSTVKKDGFTFKVTEIASKAFQNNKKAATVVIGLNVAKIGSKAFYKCSKLRNITFKSKKAPKFGSNAFKGIKAAAKVTLPKKISKKEFSKIKKGMRSAGKKIKFLKK